MERGLMVEGGFPETLQGNSGFYKNARAWSQDSAPGGHGQCSPQSTNGRKSSRTIPKLSEIIPPLGTLCHVLYRGVFPGQRSAEMAFF